MGGGEPGGRGEDGAAARPDALHVIILGSGGGPLETNITSLLVRSVASGWRRGSVVSVDAGVQLGAIKKVLKKSQPPGLGETEELSLPHTLTTGPFAGLEIPYKKPIANATHILYSLVDTWLITHPHLDHISAFVLNTAGLPGTRPKKLAGLPSTITALKRNIFNNVIWPNLSDEENGAGLITYMRLVEGGSLALGEGDSKGYLEVNDGLAVKILSVSHGHCIEHHNHRGSGSAPSGYGRQGSVDFAQFGPISVGMGSNIGMLSPRSVAHHNPANMPSSTLGSFLQQQQHQGHPGHSTVLPPPMSAGGGPGRTGSISGPGTPYGESIPCVYDSSAYFIRDITTGREILVFGDVEPDSISLLPRNSKVWAESALKIISGNLAAIFIECSYDDSQSEDRLFGHLQPRFVDEEMRALAKEVTNAREYQRRSAHASAASATSDRRHSGDVKSLSDKKRKRHGSDVGAILVRRKTADQQSPGGGATGPTSNPSNQLLSRLQTEESISPRSNRIDHQTQTQPFQDNSPHLSTPTANLSLGSGHSPIVTDSPHLATPTAELSLGDVEMSGPATPQSHVSPAAAGIHSREGTADADGDLRIDTSRDNDRPLRGLKVVIIHIKDKLNDGPSVFETVRTQLNEYEEESRTGVEYIVSYPGQSLYL
ncbi:cAMP phosphodiesterases class-II-domain-containing protein [Podospora aff. communis PSN243]|uniref:cAMP phosphodiesterases class-II-domain-containing protein n=1 Tax=Podospora aff. communis PSN243 TaxID=3040156 RepID=A0AAV9GJH5_9PEZI|nr:cAMP phosphodiesterases class-II-domain-containing protein [Podospora aff. communis PSN243]